MTLTSGRLGEGEGLELVSERERLVVFADGVESDRLDRPGGQRVTVGLAERWLRLI